MAVDMFTLVWSLVYKLSPRRELPGRQNESSPRLPSLAPLKIPGTNDFAPKNASEALKRQRWQSVGLRTIGHQKSELSQSGTYAAQRDEHRTVCNLIVQKRPMVRWSGGEGRGVEMDVVAR